ncbi:MAG TPA: alpha/beta fold hydrolase [Streptosporangiaceae bacterium]|nr:alpha/beta fold hydrolase [Streptosporangiaceae bacterium]
MRYRRVHTYLAGAPAIAVATAIALSVSSVPAQAALPLESESSAFLGSTLPVNYHASPPGANVACTPTAAHPFPVVLVEGTFASMYNSFGALSPDLVNNGYCVFAFNFGQTLPFTGFYAMGDIRSSASQLSAEVNRVLTATGASKVDIVGWSQGGMMPRYYINNLGGASKVNMLVGLAPSNYGTNLGGLTNLLADLGVLGLDTALLSVTCEACVQQFSGSSFLTSLNKQPTAPGVKYVVIETQGDEVVTPFTNAFLPAGPNVQNITLQNQCSQDSSDHISIPYDSNALQDVLNVLGADDQGFQPQCASVGPIFGNV